MHPLKALLHPDPAVDFPNQQPFGVQRPQRDVYHACVICCSQDVDSS